jgi:formamidopyrimidine-DNA glycosylase
VRVRRAKVLAPTSALRLRRTLVGGRFLGVSRRGKYLLFDVESAARRGRFVLVGHLGMTGRMYLQAKGVPLAKHAAVVLDLGRDNLVFEDTRYFGRFTLDTRAVTRLGPEPLGPEFTVEGFGMVLKRSAQPIKVKLLDQSLVAGIGNIYAAEALFRAGISPRLPARGLEAKQVRGLWRAIREVLAEAIDWGSTVRLDYPGTARRDRLFYFGSEAGEFNHERLRVYDQAGRPCPQCDAAIRRLAQAGRSTYYCPVCQKD